MASRSETRRKQAAPVKYDSTLKPIKQGDKYDSAGKSINSNSTPQSTPRPTPKPTPTTPSSTAKVPKGGAKLPPTGNLAKSLIKRGVGRLVPGLGLILTAVEVADYLRGDETDASKLEKELATLQSRYDKARELLDKPGGMDKQRMAGAGRLLSKIDEVKQQLKDLGGSAPQSKPSPSGPFPLKDYGLVKPAPRPRSAMDAARDAKEAASRVVEKVVGSDSSRPLPVDTKSKKPLAKRIMEALGDNRNMEQATRDRKMTEEMEMEREMNVAGRKKGGMGQKKKAPVKKAYGGMVKKKQGGSANKVNMKAGFTRRGCSKG